MGIMQAIGDSVGQCPAHFLLPAGILVAGGIDFAVQKYLMTKPWSGSEVEDVPSAPHDSPIKEKPGGNGFVSAGFIRSTYIAAGATGWAAALAVDRSGGGALISGLAATLSSTMVVYGGSLASRNSSVYDPYWCLLPQGLSVWWITRDPASAMLASKAVPLCLLWAWASRFHAMLPWDGWQKGLKHEDWRYSDFGRQIRSRTAYWAFSLSSFHLTPSLLVFAALVPLSKLLTSPSPPSPGLSQAVAWALSLSAIAFEATADEQLRSFMATRAYAKGSGCMMRGLWRYSRHPNYFGEVAWWASVWLMASSAEACTWWGDAGGAAFMALFFRFASIPLMDGRSLKRRGTTYARVMATTSPLVPLPQLPRAAWA